MNINFLLSDVVIHENVVHKYMVVVNYPSTTKGIEC